jgi:hypothetical protein
LIQLLHRNDSEFIGDDERGREQEKGDCQIRHTIQRGLADKREIFLNEYKN